MRTVVFTSEAQQDLTDIWEFIAKDSVTAADRVRDDLKAAAAMLSKSPGFGNRRPDVKQFPYRFWKVYSYMIAYRYDDQELVVVRIIHGARNFRRIFRARPRKT